MKKKYICVSPFFPTPQLWQGAYVLDQVKAIKRSSEYEIVVFRTIPFWEKEHSYEVDGVTVHAIAPLLMPSYILNGATEHIVGRLFLQTLYKFGIDPAEIAVIHCHTINHSAFGFGVKQVNPDVKVLVQFHDLDPLTLRNGKWADIRWNRRYRAKKSISAINRADLLICISEPVKDVILSFPHPRKGEVYDKALEMYKGIEDLPTLHPKDIYVLNNGVNLELFNVGKVKHKANGLFRIGCVANFQELKDHQSLVEAFALLVKRGYSDMRLSLLGSGETKESIQKYVIESGLDAMVEWKTEISHDRLPDYYRTLDLFVLPSIYEGFGCVYTEAYACGVPFICCERQGASECIEPDERYKWLVTPKSPEQLAAKIERYYIARDAQKLCKPYDIDILIKDFLRYINRK